MKVIARIARDPNGVCRVFVQRAKYKHWFELGRHQETDIDLKRRWAPAASIGNPRLPTNRNFFEGKAKKL